MDELRSEIYHWSLKLIKRGFKLEAIFILLSTWNFAYFRYHMREFKLGKFKKTLADCDFDFFRKKKFETVDLSNQKIVNKIKEIYNSLSQFKGIRYVGATKIMHLMNPNFFMMWDTKILKYYKKKTPRGFITTTSQGYVNFMKEVQKRWKNGKFPKPQKGETIPRAIDVYNWDLVNS